MELYVDGGGVGMNSKDFLIVFVSPVCSFFSFFFFLNLLFSQLSYVEWSGVEGEYKTVESMILIGGLDVSIFSSPRPLFPCVFSNLFPHSCLG